MHGVVRLVRGGDDASAVDRGHLEDGGLAGGTAHQDAGEIGGEVGLSVQGLFDEIPRRDQMDAGFTHPG